MSANTTYNILTQSVIQGKLPISEIIAEPTYADTLLRDISETEKAIGNGTAIIYKTPDELFAAWEKDGE